MITVSTFLSHMGTEGAEEDDVPDGRLAHGVSALCPVAKECSRGMWAVRSGHTKQPERVSAVHTADQSRSVSAKPRHVLSTLGGQSNGNNAPRRVEKVPGTGRWYVWQRTKVKCTVHIVTRTNGLQTVRAAAYSPASTCGSQENGLSAQ